MKAIVLASASPRRKALLEQAGLKSIVYPSNYNEIINEKLPPAKMAERLSLEKAKAVYRNHKKSIIIAADTLIACRGKTLGKPKNKEDAKVMLKFLSGKTHSLVTGFTIIDGNSIITKSEETKVSMKEISKTEIDEYVKSKEPFDKAGAYAIQGLAKKFITKIEGDLSNAIGLPISSIMRELKKLGVK